MTLTYVTCDPNKNYHVRDRPSFRELREMCSGKRLVDYSTEEMALARRLTRESDSSRNPRNNYYSWM